MTRYFLGTFLQGESPVIPWWNRTDRSWASEVFICPTCGADWGRIEIIGRPWIGTTRPCSSHPASLGWGSFLPPWGVPLDHLPPEVLHYELRLHLALYNKELQ